MLSISIKYFIKHKSESVLSITLLKLKGGLLFVLIFFCSAIVSVAQTEDDSLKINKEQEGLRVKLKSDKNFPSYIPIDSLNYSEVEDTIRLTRKIPGRAGLLSAIVPGLGQAYNGNYWKIPIIYSLFAGMYFIAEDNNDKYQKFKLAYSIYDDGGTVPGINPNFSKENLKEIKNLYKRNRDLNIILGVVIYLMNILDASVDAHLMDYDINEDLSFKLSPEVNSYQTLQNNYKNSSFGIKFVLSLH